MSHLYRTDGRVIAPKPEPGQQVFKATASKIHDVYAEGVFVVVVCTDPATTGNAVYVEEGKYTGKWLVYLTFKDACERFDALVARASFDGEADDLCDLALSAMREAYRNAHDGKDPPLPVRDPRVMRYWGNPRG